MALPLASSRSPTGRLVVLVLSGLALFVLAFLWHFLAVQAWFPMGGAEFHWVFHRPNGGDGGAARLVVVVYAIIAAGLALLLHARSRVCGIAIVGVVVIGAGVFASTALWAPSVEDLLGVLLLGVLLFVVALPLWRLRNALPSFAKILVAGAPGVWCLWEMYSFQYRNPPQFRQAMLPLVIIYPLVFLVASFAAWLQESRKTRGPQADG